ncbi:MAG: hypothetical protein K9H14_03270 [Actinomycetia bacterium]|nr:hypothetical protein [Actinomycetes bacterium]
MTSDSISLTLGYGNNDTGYSIPEDLKIKNKRVAKIKKAKAALEMEGNLYSSDSD